MESKVLGLFRRNLIRLGEGLVIGVGVAVVLGVYNSMSHATDELRKTRSLLEKQVEINQKLKNQIELRDQKLLQVQDLIVETGLLADNLEYLAERVRAVETVSVSGSENPFLNENFNWSQFKAPDKVSLPDLDLWKVQLDSLQDIINEQRKLQ